MPQTAAEPAAEPATDAHKPPEGEVAGTSWTVGYDDEGVCTPSPFTTPLALLSGGHSTMSCAPHNAEPAVLMEPAHGQAPYYYNSATEESLWDMPEEVVAALAAGPAAAEARDLTLLVQKNELVNQLPLRA